MNERSQAQDMYLIPVSGAWTPPPAGLGDLLNLLGLEERAQGSNTVGGDR